MTDPEKEKEKEGPEASPQENKAGDTPDSVPKDKKDGSRPSGGDQKQSEKEPTQEKEDPDAGRDSEETSDPHPYEDLLEEYPLRDPSEDPVWSVRIVKGWMWVLAFFIAGILLLLVLGVFYD